MRILGIDPGYATIGFGVVDAERGQMHMVTYGVITTPAGIPLSRRLYQISTDMEELISQVKPDVIAVEELFFNTNITTGIAVAHGRGVILCAAEKCGIPLYEYTPSQVKVAVTGYGKAEKHQVMDMTRRLSLQFTDDTDYIEQEIADAGDHTLVFELVPQHITGKIVREA